jgi:hypothetical protein
VVAARDIGRELPRRGWIGDREIAAISLFLLACDATAVGEAPVCVRQECVLAQHVVEGAGGRSEQSELRPHRAADHVRVEERGVQQKRARLVRIGPRVGHRDRRARAKAADGVARQTDRAGEIPREARIRRRVMPPIERRRSGAARKIGDDHAETRLEHGKPRAKVVG